MSLERQADVAEQWARQRGIDLDDTHAAFIDSGVSASRGKNLVKGAFARFREAVAAGDVSAGSYLLVESVSRFSRLSPMDSQPILRELVEAGIRVVFFDPSIEVNADNQHDMAVGMIFQIMGYIAKEYADTLGRYKLKAWERARTEMRNGKAATRTLPFWLKCDATNDARGRQTRGPIELHPVYAPIVKRLFRDYLAGAGKAELAERLNDERIPSPTPTGKGAGAEFWRHGLIGRTLANPAVCGKFQPHREVKTRITLKSGIAGALTRKREPIGEPVPGYYPRVISDELFAQVATVRSQNRARSGSKTVGRTVVTHILGRLAVCPLCGAAMMRKNKGTGSAPTYVCSRAMSGKKSACKRVYVKLPSVERAVIDNASFIANSAPIGDPGLQAELEALDHGIDAIDERRQELADGVAGALERGEPVSRTLNAQLVAYETKLDELHGRRVELAQRAAASSTNVLRNRVAALTTTLEAYRMGLEQVPAVNAALYECFERAVVDYRTGELVMHWRHGPPPVTVRYDSGVELQTPAD